MPLQNRVDPFGDIQAVDARGLFTGNRGIIHDAETKTLLARRWSSKAWITCVLELPGRDPRIPMGRNGRDGGMGWTELFFLDEVTALAAGHRPCFYCQRQRAQAFLACHAEASGIASPRAPDLDRQLHAERCASRRKALPAIGTADVESLPDGAMVASANAAFAVKGGELLPWGFSGYRGSAPAASLGDLRLLTPPTTVAVLRAGYRPVWHESAG